MFDDSVEGSYEFHNILCNCNVSKFCFIKDLVTHLKIILRINNRSNIYFKAFLIPILNYIL
jgi:hypothetical protein